MATTVKSKIDKTLRTMIKELKDECLKCVKLANQLELENLTEDQIDEIFGELTVSVTHLYTQSQSVKEEIEE